MASQRPRVAIIGAGMAGLAAANRLQTAASHLLDLVVVEGGPRIGGRVNSSVFCGDRVELGATWIHGIEGSPVHKIARDNNLLHSRGQPWEWMHGMPQDPVTLAEGTHELDPSLVDPISNLFQNLISYIRGKAVDEDCVTSEVVKRLAGKYSGAGNNSVGSFLRDGLDAYWEITKDQKDTAGDLSRRSLEEGVFRLLENMQRSYSASDDLGALDFNAERVYRMLPGEEITIAGGYSGVIEFLARALPAGTIQLNMKVDKIEWQLGDEDSRECGPVKLHFSNGSVLTADHVIVTVSLGVLKRGIIPGQDLFSPPLPDIKNQAISRLGYGLVNKVFLQVVDCNNQLGDNDLELPFLQMVFHSRDSKLRDPEIPDWIRKTPLLYPIYRNSRVLLSWFAGKEALELESLGEDEITKGFSITTSKLLPAKSNGLIMPTNCRKSCRVPDGRILRFGNVLRSRWGSDPLFLGSYSYVAVGSSLDDMDVLAEPLPENKNNLDSTKKLQILFAGEATDRTHYSTTHGAYFSGLREADRLLEHYNCAVL
ncbi:Probable polyamine oxidase 5 [Striga hermonthica]|uniref:Probable polyamine oxidase 5 n=1 Tax=Striga hermonthica TaxID=68872 RepID=A0A9N7MU26_STRHE|nr:Probable polyamine oxidase 5 [Striga hermonthica]